LASIVEPALDAEAGQAERGSRLGPSGWLIPAAYLFGAIVVTLTIWAHPGTMSPSDGSIVKNDVLGDYWYMRFAANAVAHGHLPALITTTLNYPQGISTMWNNTMPLPAVVLAPVTIVAGPVVSLAVMTTLGFAGSATALFFVLRRWDVSTGAAALGGAIFGFCPAMMVAALDHYQLQFMVLPPLIVHFVLRLATRRGNPLRTGALLGAVTAMEFYISEEMLVFTGIVVGLLLVLLAAHRPRAVAANAGPALQGALLAGLIVVLACSYPLWIQLHGPLSGTGIPWKINRYGNHETDFYTAPTVVLLNHGLPRYLRFLGGQQIWPLENYAYLGWTLIAGLVVITVAFWRDLRVRIPAIAFAIVELLSLGGHRQHIFGVSFPGTALPWHYIGALPLFHDAVVNRICLVADGLAAVMIAFAADHVAAAWRRQLNWRRPAFAAAAAAGLAAIVMPILPAPVEVAARTPAPAGFTQVLTDLHLPGEAPVLVLPDNGSLTMSWQAETNAPISVIGGYCLAPDVHGKVSRCEAWHVWTSAEKWVAKSLTNLTARSTGPVPRLSKAATAIRQWGAAAILCVRGPAPLVAYLTKLLGQPTASSGGVLGWRLPRPGHVTLPPTAGPSGT
jgi:hypothetical protein